MSVINRIEIANWLNHSPTIHVEPPAQLDLVDQAATATMQESESDDAPEGQRAFPGSLDGTSETPFAEQTA